MKYLFFIVPIMSTTCWGMKIPSKKSPHSTTTCFTQTRSLGSKRSFSSSKPITSRLFFTQLNTVDTAICVIQNSKYWSPEKWNAHWPLLAQTISTTDPKEIVSIWGTIYALELYPQKYSSNKNQEQRLRSIEYKIAKQNNDYIHALAAPGSNLPLLFNPSNILR